MNAHQTELTLDKKYGIGAIGFLAIFFVAVFFQETPFDYVGPPLVIGTTALGLWFIILGFKKNVKGMWLWLIAFLLFLPLTNVAFWIAYRSRS